MLYASSWGRSYGALRPTKVSIQYGSLVRYESVFLRRASSFARHPDKSHESLSVGHPSPLVDTFKRNHTYLRISLTERCNLRCRYCMPADGVELSPSSNILSTPEILRLARMFVQSGVNKIRLTGGEPTVRRDLTDIIRGLYALKEAGAGLETIAMTSNGIVLAMGTKLQDMVDAGLTHLNISLDTLEPHKFELLTRRPSKMHTAVLSTMEKALQLTEIRNTASRLHKLKLNVVVMRGTNDDEVPNFAELTRASPISVRFIEFMPFQGNEWRKNTMVKSAELIDKLNAIHPGLHPVDSLDGDQTSREWKIPGYMGTVGFISSMSDHFCASCSRLRLTADGQIKVCLFDPHEVSLKDLLRSGASDEEVMAVVGKAVQGKKSKHAGMDKIAQLSEMEVDGVKRNRSMIKIGLRDSTSRISFTNFRHKRTGHSGMHILGSQMMPISLLQCSSRNSRAYTLTHLDESGSPRMVDVSTKAITLRKATAIGTIYINELAYSLITEDSSTGTSKSTSDETGALDKARMKAGGNGRNVLTIAQLAGIVGVKYTGQLIPLCHTLPITGVDVSLTPIQSSTGKGIRCVATVKTEGKTGVEMEALTCVSTSLLTVWDMLKSVAGHEMRIEGIRVVSKEGGKSNFTGECGQM